LNAILKSKNAEEEIRAYQEAIKASILSSSAIDEGGEYLQNYTLRFYRSLIHRQAVMDNLVQNLTAVDEIKEIIENVRAEIAKTFKVGCILLHKFFQMTPYLVAEGWQEKYLTELDRIQAFIAMTTFDRNVSLLQELISQYEAAYYHAGDVLFVSNLFPKLLLSDLEIPSGTSICAIHTLGMLWKTPTTVAF